MRVAVIGLGYVGITSVACLAELGHSVIGVEKDIPKLESLKIGNLDITEPGLSEHLKKHVGSIKYTSDFRWAISNSDIVLICVGTPSLDGGATDMASIESVANELSFLDFSGPVVFRSTVPIGTTRRFDEKLKQADVYFVPEFLREGSAISDFFNPGLVVIGVGAGRSVDSQVTQITGQPRQEVNVTSFETAESVKYVCNAFHALKVTFANEIGRLTTKLGADAAETLEIFKRDRVLNISDAYLKPGFAYGGSCLPKDLSSLLHQTQGLDLPLLSSLDQSNQTLIESFVEKVAGCKGVFLLNGLAFKENTDDLRNSPFVAVAQALLDRGRRVLILDPNIHNVFGVSKEILDSLRNFETCNVNEVAMTQDAVVLIRCHASKYYSDDLKIKTEFKLFPNPQIGAIY